MGASRLPLLGNGHPTSERERGYYTLRPRLITLQLQSGSAADLPRLMEELRSGRRRSSKLSIGTDFRMSRFCQRSSSAIRSGAAMAAMTDVSESNNALLTMFQTATAMPPATALAKRGAADDH